MYARVVPPLPLASLDPHESNRDSDLPPTYGRDLTQQRDFHTAPQRLALILQDTPDPRLETSRSFRHSGWAHTRARVYTALSDTGAPQQRLDRFQHCGDRCFVYRVRNTDTAYRLMGNYCKDRFCIPCATARSHAVACQVYEHLHDTPFRFLTLTLKTGDHSLRSLLDRLIHSFRKLRAHQTWAKYVTGALAFVEIKWQPHTLRWHPHLHVLATGSYFPVQRLRSAWLKCTGDSYIVDIRQPDNLKEAAFYVAKYAGKAIDAQVYRNPARLREAIAALHGRRTILPSGSLRRWSLKPTVPATDLVYVAPLDEVLASLRDANPAAIQIVWHLFHGCDPHDKPWLFTDAAATSTPRPPPEAPPDPIKPPSTAPPPQLFDTRDYLAALA